MDTSGQLIGQAMDEAGSGQPGGEVDLAAILERSNPHYRTELNGRDMLVSKTTSPKTGWTYIAAQPADEVLESVHAMKRTTFTLVGLSLVVIVLLALWLSRRNSRPLEGLYSYVHTNAKREWRSEAASPTSSAICAMRSQNCSRRRRRLIRS